MASKRNKQKAATKLASESLPVQPPKPVISTHCPIAGFAAWGFTSLLLIGYIAFRTDGLPLPTGNLMSVPRALFASANAGTLTGFQTTHLAIKDYNPFGQWLMLVLTLGGTQFALLCGGLAVARIAKLPYTDNQVAVTSLATQLGVLILGAITLHRADQPLVATLIQASSAFGNSGIWMGASPALMDWRTHLVLLPLAFLGGLGIPVLMDLFDVLRRRRSLSPHTWTVLKLSAVVYLFAVIVLFNLRPIASAAPLVLASSSEAAINTRSAGLPIELAAEFPRHLQWILLVLMMIGAAPGGAGGGIKVTTIGRLFNGLLDLLAGRNPGRIFGIALLWMLSLCLLAFLSLLLLLWSEPGVDADRLLFIAISAATNTGLSHDRIAIVGTGMYVLTLTMLLGRILPLLVLWWVVRHADQTDVAIG